VVDLKDKLLKTDIKSQNVDFSDNTLKEEALSGLLILGFNKSVAAKAIDRVLKQQGADSVEGLIKQALKSL